MGRSLNLSPGEIHMIAMQCSWGGTRPKTASVFTYSSQIPNQVNSNTTQASSSSNHKFDFNKYSSNGPFRTINQNKFYHALKELSNKKGGFTHSDIPEISSMGKSISMHPMDIYMVALQCSWRESRPKSYEIFI